MTTNNGVKHVGFLKRKKGQSFEEFVRHWEDVHAALALRLPGLRGYVLNPIDREKYPDSPVDGFAELWFDSLEEAENAFSTPMGEAVANDASDFTSYMTVTYLTETVKR